METINSKLQCIEEILNNPEPVELSGEFQVGVDLGTSNIIVVVIDCEGQPVAAFLEWAEVVRDGVVLDYWTATQIVTRLLNKAEEKLGLKISEVITSFPPGTDPQISKNVIRAAERKVKYIIDEPSSVALLLNIKSGAVVDIGGGTTGIAVVQNGEIVYTTDEPTGGHHVTLTIAGNRNISYENAEQMKLNGQAERLLPVVQPVFEKMAEIMKNNLAEFAIADIYLSGGTFCFPGIKEIIEQEIPEKQIINPYNPLFLTPLAIASYKKG